MIRDEDDYEKHVDYIHYNPVKHGYVKCPTDWAYSSIHMYISKGILRDDWGNNLDGVDSDMFGEKA